MNWHGSSTCAAQSAAPSTSARKTPIRRRTPAIESLEGRQLLATAGPEIQMVSATTHDSRGVSFSYDVLNNPLQAPVEIGIYRSADANFSSDDLKLGALVI